MAKFLLMKGAKICQSKFCDIEIIKLRHIYGYRNYHNPNTHSHGHCTLHFKQHPSSSFNSKISSLLQFITKLNESYEVLNLLKSRLSPVWAYARCCW